MTDRQPVDSTAEAADPAEARSSGPDGESARGRGVALYLLAAFGITWGAAALRLAGAWPDPVMEALRLAVKFGPSLAGLLAAFVVFGRRGPIDLLRRLNPLTARPVWILFALLLPIGLGVIAAGLWSWLTPVELAIASGTGLSSAAALFGGELALRFFAGGGLGEELGWRGFMLPALQPRVGALSASIWIGLWHGLWHLPAQGPVVIILTVYTVAAAILFTWMANRTGGNLFLAALLHGSGNATIFAIEEVVPALDNSVGFNLIFLALWVVVAVALVSRGQLDRAQGSGAAQRSPSKRA